MGLSYKTPLPGNCEILQYMTKLYAASPFNIFSEYIALTARGTLVTAPHIFGLVRNAIHVTAP
eukprot:12602821-Prorocentrum_lima.AAC.1